MQFIPTSVRCPNIELFELGTFAGFVEDLKVELGGVMRHVSRAVKVQGVTNTEMQT